MAVVVVVMPDAEKALCIPLHSHPEQLRVHSLELADVAVRQVRDQLELGVEQVRHVLSAKVVHHVVRVVDPAEFLKKMAKYHTVRARI